MVMINIMINICFLESIDSPKPQCLYGIYDTKKMEGTGIEPATFRTSSERSPS